MLGPAGKVDDGSGGASASLRNCLGVAADLVKEVEAFRKEQFEAWQVGPNIFMSGHDHAACLSDWFASLSVR